MTTADLLEPTPALPVAEPFGHLIILDETGDSRIQWDPNDPEQVAAARARFDELKAKRYLAYKVDKNGNKGEVISKFDPNAERIILHSQMIGG
jgi:hypothetical protein